MIRKVEKNIQTSFIKTKFYTELTYVIIFNQKYYTYKEQLDTKHFNKYEIKLIANDVLVINQINTIKYWKKKSITTTFDQAIQIHYFVVVIYFIVCHIVMTLMRTIHRKLFKVRTAGCDLKILGLCIVFASIVQVYLGEQGRQKVTFSGGVRNHCVQPITKPQPHIHDPLQQSQVVGGVERGQEPYRAHFYVEQFAEESKPSADGFHYDGGDPVSRGLAGGVGIRLVYGVLLGCGRCPGNSQQYNNLQ